jgi:hypothetical protein
LAPCGVAQKDMKENKNCKDPELEVCTVIVKSLHLKNIKLFKKSFGRSHRG